MKTYEIEKKIHKDKYLHWISIINGINLVLYSAR